MCRTVAGTPNLLASIIWKEGEGTSLQIPWLREPCFLFTPCFYNGFNDGPANRSGSPRCWPATETNVPHFRIIVTWAVLRVERAIFMNMRKLHC